MMKVAIGSSAAILDSDFVAIVLVKNRRIVWANAAMHKLFGYEPNALADQPTRMFFPDEASYIDFGKKAYCALAEGKPYHGEFEQKRNDGTLGWFEFNLSRLDGHPDTVVGAIVDRTERRKALNQLEIQSGILAAISDGVNIVGPDGTILFTNHAFDAMLGYADGELLGRHIAIVNADQGQSPQAVARAIIDHVKSFGRWSGDILNRRKDGTTLRTEADVAARELGPWGTVLVSVQRDVTIRRQLDDKLRESEERLALALTGSGLFLWDWHIPAHEMLGGKGLAELLGYRGDELGTREETWMGLIDPRDRERVNATLAEHLDGETSDFHSRHRLRHKEGHWIAIEARGKVIARDAEHHPLRMVGTLLDVSPLERLQAQGIDLLKRMEMLIHGATAQNGPDAKPDERVATLTTRQRQILSMIADGMTSAEIGRHLNLATNTIVSHRRNLMAKLDLHSPAEVTRFAVDHGLIEIR